LHSPEAQKQPKAEDSVFHAATVGAGAPLPVEALPLDPGAGRVQQQAAANGDPSEDLVSGLFVFFAFFSHFLCFWAFLEPNF
jgi:hypothetical protein